MIIQAAEGQTVAPKRVRPGPPHVIGVVSGRGGSGASLVAAALALRSTLAGLRTLLVDADPWLDMQRVWLGLPKGPTLESLRRGREPESLVTPVSPNLELISFGEGENAERDNRALARRVSSVFSARDIVVVDAGSRLESLTRCVDLRVGSILIVSGADALALASTHALFKAMRALMDLRPSVLFNRVDGDEAVSASAVLCDGGRRFLGAAPAIAGHLPDDPGLRVRLSDGASIPESLIGSPITSRMAEVMRSLQPWQAT